MVALADFRVPFVAEFRSAMMVPFHDGADRFRLTGVPASHSKPSGSFTKRLRRAGFHAEMINVRERAGDLGAHHAIWFAQRPWNS